MKVPKNALRCLRSAFREACTSEYHKEALREFLMVGAVMGQGEKYPCGIFFDDINFLRGFFIGLHARRIPIAQDFNLSIANINASQGGEDFLKADIKADAVLICIVNASSAEDLQKEIGEQFEVQKKEIADFLGVDIDPFLASPYHLKKKAWSDAAIRAGAKMVGTVYVPDDVQTINPEHFQVDSKYVLSKGPTPIIQSFGYNMHIGMLQRADWCPPEFVGG